MVKDIVCGMDIETVSAAGSHQHDDEFQLSFGHHECTSVKRD